MTNNQKKTGRAPEGSRPVSDIEPHTYDSGGLHSIRLSSFPVASVLAVPFSFALAGSSQACFPVS